MIDCDAVYHQMLESDTTLQGKLEKAFGPLRDKDGRIDRKRLGAIVFQDSEKLEQLNEIVRQSVCAKVASLVTELENQGRELAAIDAFALSIFRYVPKAELAQRLPAALRDAQRTVAELLPQVS